jgi:hypothetical protein
MHMSPLCYLHLFNMIWDVCPDMMHIVKNWMEKMMAKTLGGKRVPAWDSHKNQPPNKNDPDYDGKTERRNTEKKRFREAVACHKRVMYTTEEREEIDYRVRSLANNGPSAWLKISMVHNCFAQALTR